MNLLYWAGLWFFLHYIEETIISGEIFLTCSSWRPNYSHCSDIQVGVWWSWIGLSMKNCPTCSQTHSRPVVQSGCCKPLALITPHHTLVKSHKLSAGWSPRHHHRCWWSRGDGWSAFFFFLETHSPSNVGCTLVSTVTLSRNSFWALKK